MEYNNLEIKTWIDLTNLNIPNKEQVANEINSLPASDWFWVKFHGAWMCSLYNDRLDVGWLDPHSYNKNLPANGAAVVALRDYIFPFLGGSGNVTVIKTQPGDMLNDHVDSHPDEIGKMMYKFRWVVQGEKSNTLYFYDKHMNKVRYQPTTDAYVMNGAHPHGMENIGTEQKLTICIGSPWKVNETFLKNIETLPYTKVELPEKILDEWNDPRFKNQNKIGLGITEFKTEVR